MNGKNSYLRRPENAFDFIVITFSVASMFGNTNSKSFNKLKVLRILRVLRPLRLISRSEGLKLAINSLSRAIPNILNLLIVCFIFFLLFGIFGVNYFKGIFNNNFNLLGTFFYCDITTARDKWDCMDLGGNWVNQDFNFDNIYNAIISLFILALTEGWTNLMW